ncbi:MAG: hypothetical protein K1W19_00850 [Lachnospiraceae bacterium]|nr:hypothetical protein [Lachnospiraceae bacterium]MCI8826404.1 hypothetical protein [Lachnospiraceae bacterium]
MMRYIIKKMISDWKTTIGNILFISCLIAVLMICCHVAMRIQRMVKNKWYKNSLEVASINDAFIREKMGAILWMILILVGMISVFCLVVYALKLRLDIIKEDKHIKLFQILGYTKQRQTGALYFGKMIETLLSFITGSIIAYNTWNYLCKQKIFLGLVTMMDERADFQLLVIWIVLLVFVIWNFLIIFWVIKKTLF